MLNGDINHPVHDLSGHLKHVWGTAVTQILSSTFFPAPDDPEPSGPGAPVIRELVTLLGMYEIVSHLSHPETRAHLEKALASAISVQAHHLAHLSEVSLNPQPIPPGRTAQS